MLCIYPSYHRLCTTVTLSLSSSGHTVGPAVPQLFLIYLEDLLSWDKLLSLARTRPKTDVMTVKGSNFHLCPHHGGCARRVPVEGNLSCAPPPGPVTGGTGRHMCAWITNPPTHPALPPPLSPPSLPVESWHRGERTWGIREKQVLKCIFTLSVKAWKCTSVHRTTAWW